MDAPLLERIWRATEGIPGEISKLFKRAVELTVRHRSPEITQVLLAEAHAQGADVGPKWKNVLTVKVLPELDQEDVPDESRVTRLTKGIARVGSGRGGP